MALNDCYDHISLNNRTVLVQRSCLATSMIHVQKHKKYHDMINNTIVKPCLKTFNVQQKLFCNLKTHLIRVSGHRQMRNQRVRRSVQLSRFPLVYFVLNVFGEPQRACERDRKHDEERDHGYGEECVQTPAAGARGGRLTLDICGRGHLQKQSPETISRNKQCKKMI